MKTLFTLVVTGLLATVAGAASLKERIAIEAFIVTKAELRRHVAAPEDDKWRPATYADLAAIRDNALPNYLVLRFLTNRGGYQWGQVEAKFDHGKYRLNVSLGSNRDWVEYFIPLDGDYATTERVGKTRQLKAGSPTVTVKWKSLYSK